MSRSAVLAVVEPELVTRAQLMPNMSGADTDHALVDLWVAGQTSAHTRRAYAGDAVRFLEAVDKPLRAVTLLDVQAFAASLTGSAKSRARAMGSVKSLLSFGQKTGYLQFNVGKAFKLPRMKNTLAERILSAEEAIRLIAMAPEGRDRTMIRLMYTAGIRVSEVCGLSWRDLQPRDKGGQITVYGKGGRTRVVLVPKEELWSDLCALRGDAPDNWPVFVSRKLKENGEARKEPRLDTSAVLRIVQNAARIAKVKKKVSPHWFRHSHASHAMERGAPIHLVQATLGHEDISTTGRYLHARPTESSASYIPGD